MRRYSFFSSPLLMASLAVVSPSVVAMTALSDALLSDVVGRDGLTIIIETPNTGLSADSIEWHTDVGGFDADRNGIISTAEAAFEAAFQYDTVSARSVDLTGKDLGLTPVTLTQTLDLGVSGADPLLNYQLDVSRVRLQAEAMRISSQPGVSSRSYGTWALDAPLSMAVRNKGLFNSDYDKAYVRGEIGRSDPNTGAVLEFANLFYRQAPGLGPYMTMHEFHALWEMPEGTFGIDNEGIVWRTGYGGRWDEVPESRVLSEADLINLALDFEYLYKDPALHGETQSFVTTANDQGLMHFGWLGSIKDVDIRWRAGGTWYGTTPGPGGIGDIYNVGNQSGGLNLSATWDYVSRAEALALGEPEKEFRWRLGETADVCPNGTCAPGQNRSRINFELGDWTLWGSRSSEGALNGTYDYGNGLHTKPAASHFPMIALDIINGAGQGAGGLCWGFAYNGPAGTCGSNGGQFINVLPGHAGFGLNTTENAGGLALHIRDGQLQAFSRQVRLLERDAQGQGTITDFDWGLIYALANVDGSIYLYPGGLSPSDNGIIADIMLMSQTFSEEPGAELSQGFNWDHGTHLVVADTNIDGTGIGKTRNAMGVGFLSSSFLLAANDTAITVLNQQGNDYYSAGLQFLSPATRFHYKATFGGGVLPDDSGGYGAGPRIVQAALLDLNLEGSVGIRFSPSGPSGTWSAAEGQYTGPYNNARNYLGYSAAMRIGTISGAAGFEGNASSGQYGSHLSLAEPGRPDVAWRFANVEGNLAFSNGMIDLRGTNEDGDGKPKLVIANNMLIGRAATGTLDEHFGSHISVAPAVNPELRTNMMLGSNTVGTAVIPSATVFSSITLTPQ